MRVNAKWMVGMVVVILLATVPLLLEGYAFRPLFSIGWYKLIHIIGGVLFIGNIVVTGVWMDMARRTNDPRVVSFATVMVDWLDLIFTGPGVFLILVSGIVLATPWGGVMGASWITAAVALFVFSGIVWVVFLLPSQRRLVRLAQEAVASGSALSREYHDLLGKWFLWGAAATLSPLGSLVLMITKPALW